MGPLSPNVVKYFTIFVRIVLGSIFLLSSIPKIADPAAFAVIVGNYQLFSPQLVTVAAMLVPWIEAVCGLALVIGRFEKGAALLVSLMMLVFIGLLLYNSSRGLNIACGCFSLAAKEPSSIALNTFRNLLILGAGAWVLFYSHHQRMASAGR